MSDIIEYVKDEYNLSPNHTQRGLESYDGVEYVQCLDWLKTQRQLTNFIEIGSAWGGSFHLWSMIVDGKKISIDANPESVPYQYPNLTEDDIQTRNAKWNSYFTDVHSVLADAHDTETVDVVSDILNDDLVDWLYIDAEHSYDSAKLEFELYSPFVNRGGFIGFHDIQLMNSDGNTSLPGCGVFWEELKNSGFYKCVEFSGRDTKIGVLQIPED